ncbi:hypothetical protein K1719_027293 [Acacia pycnantha]|nr:hypothetical protein K1719_027293 [Acacia pycnantha]
MESTDSSTGSQQPNLPPGFRFHPTDEELVVHYLKKKVSSAPLPVAIIAEVDLYKFDPWELPAKAAFGEQEWYFFSPRDRKYPNGARPNRAATSGYWKATGTDKPVLTSNGNQKVGVKKALVFYGGKPPRGIKTNWIMHEYRILDNKPNNKPPGCDLANKKNSLRLDDWVLCRIYKKTNTQRSPMDHERDDSMDDIIGVGGVPASINVGQMNATRFHLSKMSTLSYGGTSLLENHHHHHDQNLLEGVISSTNNNNKESDLQLPFVSAMTASTASNSNTKRTLSSLYWGNNNEDEDLNGTKRLSLDEDHHHHPNNNNNEGGSNSIATLLNQIPQTPPLHHQSMLGSYPYSIPGMNWYA